MRNIKLYVGILLLFYGTLSSSQTPQFPFELQEGYLPSRAMRVFTGSQADTSFQMVKSKVIQRLNRDSSDLRISEDSVMWLRFIFKNPTNDSIWRVFVENNNIRQMLLFNKSGQVMDWGGYSIQKFFLTKVTDTEQDSHIKFTPNQHVHLVFHLDSAQTDTFYLLINNTLFRTATYLYLDSDENQNWNSLLSHEEGKMEMMLFIYVLFTLLLIFLGRDGLYFYYFLYISGVYFYYVASSGLGFWVYWTKSINFESVAFLIGNVWAMSAFFLVLRSFLELPVKIPILNKIILGIVGYGFVIIVLSGLTPLIHVRQWVYDSINILFLIGLLLVLVSLLSGRLRSNHKHENWLFIFALLPVFVISLLILCCEMDFTHYRILDFYNKYACLAMSIEMFLMALLLTWRVYRHISETGRAKNQAEQLHFKQQLAYWEKQVELQTQKEKVHNLIHNYLTNEVRDILYYTNNKYESDASLKARLQNLLTTCKVGDMVVYESNLIRMLSCLVAYFNNAQASQDDDAPSLTLIYDESDEKWNNIQLNIDLRSEIHSLLREALGNMRKYARYQYALLTVRFLTEDCNSILLELKDDGVGLPTTLELEEDVVHLNEANYQTYSINEGLKFFFKSARQIGGRLTIDSKRDEGTTIQLIFSPNSGEQLV